MAADAQHTVDTVLDRVLSGMKQWTPEERARYCDDGPEHPLFMNRAPTPAEMAANPHLAALANMAYEGDDTPEALALEAKEKGNRAFSQGADYYGHAIRHYNECLDHLARATPRVSGGAGTEGASNADTDVDALRAAAWANLAAIYLARRKYITAAEAAESALRVSGGRHVKAAFRAAKAYLALGRAVTALDIAQLGLEAEPANAALLQVAADAAAARAVQRANAAATRAEADAREASLAAVRAAAGARGILVGPPLFQGQRRTAALPYVAPRGAEDAGALHWPVLLLYPEYGTSDYVEDVAEGAAVGDVLAAVLPDGAPPAPWDARPGEYVAGNVDVFLRTAAVRPAPLAAAWTEAGAAGAPGADAVIIGSGGDGGEDDASDAAAGFAPLRGTDLPKRWVLVPPDAPLAAVLRYPGYVVPDVPVLYAVARSGLYHAELRQRCGGGFAALEVPPPETAAAEEGGGTRAGGGQP